jgi:hypothetical protein
VSSASPCPHCGKPVDQGRHTKIGSGGGQDESGSRYVEARYRCDEVFCCNCAAPAYLRATPLADLFFCTHACANDYAVRKTVRFSLKTLAGGLALLAMLLPGCAALSREPGSPYGGAYCTQRGGDPEPACYPTETERSAAWHQREAEGRKAWDTEHPAEVQARETERRQLELARQEGQRARRRR